MVTTVEREEILEVVIGLFGGAPGKENQAELEAVVDGGTSVQQLANLLGDSAGFTNNILAGNTTVDSQVAILMNNFGLIADPADATTAGSQADLFFRDSLTDGFGFGEIVYASVTFLERQPLAQEFTPTATLLANKVKVADLFSLEDSPIGSGDVTALQGVLAGVVTSDDLLTDLEAQAIVDPFLVVDGPFTLPSGLVALSAAEAAKDTFLLAAGQDPEVDGDEAALTEQDVADAATGAVTALDVLVTGDYAGGSSAVRAALLADEVELRADALTDAQTAQTEAQAAIDAVPGLSDAVTDLKAAKEANLAAEALVADPGGTLTANLDAALANFNTLTGEAATIDVDGTDNLDAFIELVGDNLVLAGGVTEEDKPGVTALLAASVAFEAGELDAAAAVTAETDAQLAVDALDQNAAATAALAAVGAGMVAVTPADVNAPTAAEITSETTQLAALVATLDTDIGGLTFDTDDLTTEIAHDALTAAAVTAGYISAADEIAINTAFNNALALDNGSDLTAAIVASQTALGTNNVEDEFQALVATFNAATGDNDLVAALTTADTAVDGAQEDIDDLDAAVVVSTEADADVTQLASLNDDITAAETAFTDNDLEVPVTLIAGVNNASADNDIFLFDDQVVASSIANFSALGSDTLFIGTGFTFNAGDIATDGNDTVLEVFAVENGPDTDITLETSAFGSSAATPEVFVITLTGVALADVTLGADGLVTLV